MAKKSYYEMRLSMNKYKAHVTNSGLSSTSDYVVEVSYDEADEFNTGKCSLTLFTKGKSEDFMSNDWTISYISQGNYHFKGTYNSIDAEVECFTPQQEITKIKIHTYSDWTMEKFAELYFNSIVLLSNCSNIEEYNTIQRLSTKEFKAYSLEEVHKEVGELLTVKGFITNCQEKGKQQEQFIKYLKLLLNDKFKVLKQSLDNINLG